MAAHQGPPSLGFSRQEHWSGLPFELIQLRNTREEKRSIPWSSCVYSRNARILQYMQISQCDVSVCVSCLVGSDSLQPHRRQPTRLPRPWDSPGKNTGVGCHSDQLNFAFCMGQWLLNVLLCFVEPNRICSFVHSIAVY